MRRAVEVGEEGLSMGASVQRRGGGKDQRPVVAIWFGPSIARAEQRVLALARERGWRVIDIRWYDWELPPDLGLAGIIAESHAVLVVAPQLLDYGCPVVRFGSFPHPDDGEVPAVIPDFVAAGRMAAEHFAERNFRHVGHTRYNVGGNNQPMFDAFTQRALELGCESHRLDYRRLCGDEAALPARGKAKLRDAELRDWLVRVPKPMGLFIWGDSEAARATVRCHEAGLDIPGQIAVLGNGNDPVTCGCAPVRLSSVDTRLEYRAEVAVELLADLMAGKPRPKGAVSVPPSGVAVRESSDVLATADPEVARAVRFLWDHSAERIGVEDVAAAVGRPRRSLERAFRDSIGRGINEELRRRRLEHCCELLRTTELSVTDLAPLAGFQSTHYLHVSFRRAYGVSPLEYRRQQMG